MCTPGWESGFRAWPTAWLPAARPAGARPARCRGKSEHRRLSSLVILSGPQENAFWFQRNQRQPCLPPGLVPALQSQSELPSSPYWILTPSKLWVGRNNV